jgi:OmpA-OmpF porin, OOP family
MASDRALILAGVIAAFGPGLCFSQDSGESQSQGAQGYVVESLRPGNIVTSGTGECVHTGSWTSELSMPACDGAPAREAEAATPATQAPAARQSAEAPPAAPAQAAAPAAPAPEGSSAAVAPLPGPGDRAAEALPPPAQPANPKLETALLPQTVHYSGDAFFDFDESALKPEGQAILDNLVRELGGVSYGTILVVGHTDRFGGAEYNQALSERRANAVKNYLIRSEIPADRIEVVGKGKSEPVTKPGDCRGPVNPKVVACLQPDRRVDIEVSGTKEVTTGSR